MKKARGFSLIELLVVLVMITIMAASVSIAVNRTSPEKELNTLGFQLFAKMNFAIDESLMQRKLIGLRIVNQEKKSAYYWYSFTNNRWQLLNNSLAGVVIPDNIFIERELDSDFTDSLLAQTLNDTSEEKALVPDIVFYPNSDISEFTITIGYRDTSESDHTFRIMLDKYGQLSHSLEAEIAL